MVLSDEQIEEFQRIYKSYLGKEISKEDAYEKGIKLLRLMSIIYKPITETELALIKERDKIILEFLKAKLSEKEKQSLQDIQK